MQVSVVAANPLHMESEMEHIAAIMLLVGCSHGGAACEELPAPQVAFESMEECTSALPGAIGGAAGGGKIVRARCAVIDPAWLEEDVEISWELTRDGGLEVHVVNHAENTPKVYVLAENHTARKPLAH
jgi:hypothetical protein